MVKIGESLRNARLEKGIRIDEIVKETKIRSRYLDALENEEWHVFPGHVYLKGFLKTYCNYLGLDERVFLAALGNEIRPVEPDSYKVPQKIEMPGRPRKKLGFILGIIAIILLTASQYIYLTFFNQPALTKERGGKPEINAVAGEAGKQPGNEPGPGTGEPSAPPTAGQDIPVNPPQDVTEGLNLTLKSLGSECWVRIRDGRQIIFEGILKNGEEKLFSGLTALEFTLGNSGAIQYYVNGVDYGIPGIKGQVITKKYILENSQVKEIIPAKETKPAAEQINPPLNANPSTTT